MTLQYTLNQIKSSNLTEHDPILFNNVKEIMDSRDPYYIKQLYDFIKNDYGYFTTICRMVNVRLVE